MKRLSSKHDEVDVLASNQFGRATDGRISEDGRALFSEFDEQNFTWPPRDRQTRLDDFPHESQKCAERNPDPTVGVLQSCDAYGEIHGEGKY